MQPGEGIGADFAAAILAVADLLKGTSAPGGVPLGILLATLIMMVYAHLQFLRATSYPRDRAMHDFG